MLDGSAEDLRNTGVMVNADGDFIVTKPDQASWELYQEKVKATAPAAAEAAAEEQSRELQAWGLECPIDKRVFLEPTKTPCCEQTYCNDCITNALIESDFVCPGCGTEGVLLDNLTANDEVLSKIKAYETEKADSKKEKEKQSTPTEDPNKFDTKTAPQNTAVTEGNEGPLLATASSKKRPAEEPAADETTGDPSSASSLKKPKSDGRQSPPDTYNLPRTDASTGFPHMPFSQQMPFGMPGFIPGPGLPGAPFPDNGFVEGMGLMNPMGMPPGNAFPSSMASVWNPMSMMSMNFNALPGTVSQNRAHGVIPNDYRSAGAYSAAGEPSMNMFTMPQMPGPLPQNPGCGQGMTGGFSNQQRTSFNTPFSREEDSPYFRQPVNPQRHQTRHRRIRPSDYREL